MRILLAATPADGHVNPLLGLAKLARDRGHEVLMTTGSRFAAKVAATGAAFLPLRGDADLDLRRMEEAFPGREAAAPGAERFMFDFEHIFLKPIPAQAESLRAAIAHFSPDIVATDASFFGRGVLFRDRRRPPLVAVNTTCLVLPRRDGAPFGLGLPPARGLAQRLRYALIARAVRKAIGRPLQARLDAALAPLRLNGAPPTLLELSAGAADAHLQPSVPPFEFDVGPLPPTLHFIGALVQPAGLHPALPPQPAGLHPVPPEEPHGFDDRPIVLVTQGTAANVSFDELINPALQALAGRDDLQVVAVTAGRPIESVEARPGQRVVPYADFAELIPRVTLLVTNGGFGAVTLALRSGVPILAVGQTEDKAEVGIRIATAGVGLAIATVAPNPDALREAIARLLAEPSFRRRARELATDYAAIDTAGVIFGVFDGLVAVRAGDSSPSGRPGGPDPRGSRA